MNRPFVSIIFPTFNGWQDTKECLKSIANVDYPQTKIEVIVVNNASTDETAPLIRQNFSRVKLLPQKKNLGFAKAVNQGIKKSQADYILITNNDVVFDSHYLKNLVNFLQQNPDVGIVGGKVYYKHPKNKVAFPGARFNFYTGLLRPNKNPNKTAETDWVPGCNMLIKRKVLEEIGGFDEKFFFYFEDLDLCLRAKKAGYKVIYYPKAIMFHGEGASIEREGWQKKSELYYQGKTRILFKHGTKLQIVSSLLFQFFPGLAFQLLVLRHQNYTFALRALIENTNDFYLNPPSRQNNNLPTLFSKQLLSKRLPSITVIFPTFNGQRLITKVLESIRSQNYPHERIEVIVIDNASTDGTADIIKKNFPWVKLIRLPQNTGSAPPITLGAKIARGDYILATNDDVIFDKNCLRKLTELTLSDDSRIGVVTGKMLDLTPPHQPLFFGFRVNLYLGYHTYDFQNSDKIRECGWAPGACIFVKKTLMEKAGYFDNDYIFCGDDHDFCFQIRSLGYKIIYNPQAIYYHGFTRARGQNGPTQEHLFAHYRGKIRFMIKNATILQIATFFPTQIIFGPVYSYFKFGHKTFFPLIRGLIWNISQLKQTLKARHSAKMRRDKYLKWNL